MEEKNVAEEKVGKKTSGAKKKPDKEGHRVTFSKVITPPPLPAAAALLWCLATWFMKIP